MQKRTDWYVSVYLNPPGSTVMIDELAIPILHVCMMSLVRRAAEKRQQEPGNGGCAGGVRVLDLAATRHPCLSACARSSAADLKGLQGRQGLCEVNNHKKGEKKVNTNAHKILKPRFITKRRLFSRLNQHIQCQLSRFGVQKAYFHPPLPLGTFSDGNTAFTMRSWLVGPHYRDASRDPMPGMEWPAFISRNNINLAHRSIRTGSRQDIEGCVVLLTQPIYQYATGADPSTSMLNVPASAQELGMYSIKDFGARSARRLNSELLPGIATCSTLPETSQYSRSRLFYTSYMTKSAVIVLGHFASIHQPHIKTNNSSLSQTPYSRLEPSSSPYSILRQAGQKTRKSDEPTSG
ncbi:uncharacterized protein H6S33_006848 [Morchella sextelata]|uniref:uncharacterized protein n=1 Tax=Morchella sextelata TaxID=1174677 RepID=UPI001D059321|nr:uncharacterized protein H6S33_006848 [Morchella sextelata]KAH0604471.1 hypothetical protein H6S33_006848 [Morchella sextelata]